MSRTPLLRLIIGILPFDLEAILDFVRVIQKEAQDTSWRMLARRLANVCLIVIFISLLGIATALYFEEGTGNLPVPNIGLGYFSGIAIVSGLVFIRYLITLAKMVQGGYSPLGTMESERAISVMELLIGLVLLVSVILVMNSSDSTTSLINFIFVFAFVGVVSGIFFMGLLLSLSGLWGLIGPYFDMGRKNARLDWFDD